MIKIYHNPRCSKSRQGLAILEASGKDFEIIKYLENNLTVKDLEAIIAKLNIQPIDLIRKNEAIWKSDFKGKTLSNKAIIEAMVAHPKLIERPIVVKDNSAVVGRPPELIKDFIK
ncbi:arsenate reductase (glutaredoxin) [Winogradskyella sp. PC D3.3]